MANHCRGKCLQSCMWPVIAVELVAPPFESLHCIFNCCSQQVMPCISGSEWSPGLDFWLDSQQSTNTHKLAHSEEFSSSFAFGRSLIFDCLSL